MCVAARNREKKFTKNPCFAVQGCSRSSMHVGSPGKLVSSACYNAQLDWMTLAETLHFEGGTQIWCTRTECSFNLGGRTLHCWNLCSMPNISYTGCSGLSRMVLVQFTLKMCIVAWNREKFSKTFYFWGSRSFKVIDVGTTGKLVGSACYDKQQVCLSATVLMLDEPILVK